MLLSGDSSHMLDQTKSTPNSLRLTSVKGKKGAPRKKNINGDQGSAGGVLRSNRIGFNQMSAGLVGDDGQRSSSDGKFRFGDVDGVHFNAGAGSSRGKSEERGFCPKQDASKAEQNLGVFSALSSQGSMKGEQTSMGIDDEHRAVLPGRDTVVNEGMQAVGGASTSDISNHCAMEGGETEEMELEARSILEDPQC
nr:hypothetical protein CFP56_43001 [Quercus suber]